MHKLLFRPVTAAAIVGAFATTGHAQPAPPAQPPSKSPAPAPQSMPQGSAKAYQDGFGPMGAFTTRELCRAQTFHVDPDRDAGTRLQAGKGFGRAKEYDKAREQFLVLLCTYNQYDAYGNLAVTNEALAAQLGADSWLLPQAVEAAHLCLTRIPHAPFASTASRDELKAKVKRIIEEHEKEVVHIVISAEPQWTTLRVDGLTIHADQLRNGVYVSANEKHVIEASAPDHATQTREVEFEPATKEHVHFKLDKPKVAPPPNGNGHTSEPLPLWPTIAGAVVSAAAIGAGVGLWFVGEGQVDDADALRAQLTTQGATCPQDCGELNAMYDDASTSQNAAIALWGVGGAVAAGTVIYAVMRGSSSNEDSGLRVQPVLAPSVAGVQLRIGF